MYKGGVNAVSVRRQPPMNGRIECWIMNLRERIGGNGQNVGPRTECWIMYLRERIGNREVLRM